MRSIRSALFGIITAGLTWSAAVAEDEFTDAVLQEADQSKGLQIYTAQCGACHTLMVGGGNLVGPNLGDLFKRKAATKEGYSYSDAFQAESFEWTPDKLAEWMRDPDAFLPGNKMPMFGAVAEEDLPHLLAYVAVRTGSVEWGQEDVPTDNVANMEGPKLTPLEQQLYDTRQDFWHHLFDNTAHYIIQSAEGEDAYTFVAYFNEDGTMGSNIDGLKGFWRVNDLKWFCYALEGIPVAPYEWTECFPIVPNSVERYGQGLWVSEPVPGIKVKGGFIQGRPHPDIVDDLPSGAESIAVREDGH